MLASFIQKIRRSKCKKTEFCSQAYMVFCLWFWNNALWPNFKMQTVLLRVVGSDTKLGQLLTKVLIKMDMHVKINIHSFWKSRSDTIIFCSMHFTFCENIFSIKWKQRPIKVKKLNHFLTWVYDQLKIYTNKDIFIGQTTSISHAYLSIRWKWQ